MIDNRPRKRYIKTPAAEPPAPMQQPAAPEPGIPDIKAGDVSIKSALPQPAMAGIAGLGGLGILPLVLVVSALQRGRGQIRPAAPPELPALPQPIKAEAKAELEPPAKQAVTGSKRKGHLRSYRKPAAPAQPAEPQPEPEPAAQAAPRPARPVRPGPRPQEIRSLLSDLAGYLPGMGNASATRISKIIGIADELRSIDSTDSYYATSLPADPLDRNIGLLNALSRNLPIPGASGLGRASQVLTLINTLKGGGQDMGNIAGMAGMLRSAMAPQQQQEIKNVTPSQADGLKDTVNKLLSGMDDKQKSELLNKAKDFLGRGK